MQTSDIVTNAGRAALAELSTEEEIALYQRAAARAESQENYNLANKCKLMVSLLKIRAKKEK